MEGTIDFNDQNLATSKFNLSIDISSIKTGNGMRDKKHKLKNGLALKIPRY